MNPIEQGGSMAQKVIKRDISGIEIENINAITAFEKHVINLL